MLKNKEMWQKNELKSVNETKIRGMRRYCNFYIMMVELNWRFSYTSYKSILYKPNVSKNLHKN